MSEKTFVPTGVSSGFKSPPAEKPQPLSTLKIEGYRLGTKLGGKVELFKLEDGIAYGRFQPDPVRDPHTWQAASWWAEDGTCEAFPGAQLMEDGPPVVFATKQVVHETKGRKLTGLVQCKWEGGVLVGVEVVK